MESAVAVCDCKADADSTAVVVLDNASLDHPNFEVTVPVLVAFVVLNHRKTTVAVVTAEEITFGKENILLATIFVVVVQTVPQSAASVVVVDQVVD